MNTVKSSHQGGAATGKVAPWRDLSDEDLIENRIARILYQPTVSYTKKFILFSAESPESAVEMRSRRLKPMKNDSEYYQNLVQDQYKNFKSHPRARMPRQAQRLPSRKLNRFQTDMRASSRPLRRSTRLEPRRRLRVA